MARTIEFELHVHYGFVYFQPLSADPIEDIVAARGGQVNGICGAAYPGVLAMITGLHTGRVPFSVCVAESEPELTPEWQDVVEVSLDAEDEDYHLATFDTSTPLELPRATTYRARYCAVGMDAAHAQDTRMDGDPVTDRYALTLWPAPHADETIVREGSQLAAYWHGVARETPLPPQPPTPEDDAVARAREAEEQARSRVLRARRDERLLWGGGEPSENLRAAGRNAVDVARTDRVLAEQLAALDPATQRRVAHWSARAACERAGPGNLDWQLALDALERGAGLLAPFDDHSTAWQLLYSGASTTNSGGTSASAKAADDRTRQSAECTR